MHHFHVKGLITPSRQLQGNHAITSTAGGTSLNHVDRAVFSTSITSVIVFEYIQSNLQTCIFLKETSI